MNTIKDLRIEAGLTIHELSNIANVSTSSISRIEAGKVPVRRLVATRVLKALNQALGKSFTLDDIQINIVD